MRWQVSLLAMLLCASSLHAQGGDAAVGTEPRDAFLKSLVLPGWGHYAADRTDWTRGQLHLAAELSLLLSYAGFTLHADRLQENWLTYARNGAGVDITSRDRRFRLAVGDFPDLQAYNDYQLRNRNWNRIYEDRPENRWQWEGAAQREQYRDLRRRFERLDRQLPALLALMVVNRVVSAVSAYNRARARLQNPGRTAFRLVTPPAVPGVLASLTYRF